MRVGKFELLILLIWIIPIIISLYVVYLIIKALKKYIQSENKNDPKSVELKASLGEVLKVKRTENKMTQEYVAEKLGVSRQAVSKWESGKSDPSTLNLISLADLYGVSVDELLKSIKNG